MRRLWLLLHITLFILLPACREENCECPYADGYIPVAPDYTDATLWVTYTNDRTGDGADIFYVPSTWEFDWTASGGLICHYADPSIETHRADMKIEMDGVAQYMADGNNFYSPYYRHITLDTWATLDEDLITRRYGQVSFEDVRRAFEHFIANFNQDRPFILAGFSQGGKSVVELMKILSPDLQHRLVAAYVLGYKVTPEDTAVAPWIKGAQGAGDTGVTVCYNSVSDVAYIKPIVAAPNEICINPVNWLTDATPAALNDSVTVTLDPRYNVLVVDGYDGSELPDILGILNTGDYHGAEPWLYSDCLHENILLRIRNFRKYH